MFSVVIIDDEALVRIGLKSMINWEENECQIVAEASNGQQGLEIIEKYRPDIVITDIKMPVLDGIGMMRQLDLRKGPKYIVLSSYDEFNLVRQAMKLGAIEYLIKLEFEPDTLINAIFQAKKIILLEQEEHERKGSLERQVRINKPVMREEFFRKLVGNLLVDKKELAENIDLLEIELDEDALMCIFIKIYEMNNISKFGREDIQLFDFSVVNIVDEILNDTFKGYVFKWSQGEYAAVISYNINWSMDLLSIKLSQAVERLIQMLKLYFNISVSIGISDIHRGFKELGKAFLQGNQAVESGFFKGFGSYTFYNECCSDNQVEDTIDMSEFKSKLRKAIELSDTIEIRGIFGEVIQLLSREKITKQTAYDVCCHLAYLVSSLYDEDLVKSVMGYEDSLYTEIQRQNSLPEITNWLDRFGVCLCTILENNNAKNNNNRLIVKAKQFINDHIKEEIKLNELAAILAISPGYLSTLFKQVTGKNFIDYTTEVKIEYAKKLLRKSNLKIYQVSDTMGYENAYYFSRVFRKVTGMTPREFMDKL